MNRAELAREQAHPLHWSCAACGAEQGERCRSRTGRMSTAYHADRWDAVHRWQRYGAHNGTGGR